MNKSPRSKWRNLTLYLVFTAILFSGCWDQRPIEEMGLIAAIGLDWNAIGSELIDFTMTYPLFFPDRTEGIKVDTLPAHNLGEAIALWEQRNALSFAAGKVRVVLLGEELARTGLPGFFDYLQLPLSDDNALVAVIRGRSESMLRAKIPETERIALYTQALLFTGFREGNTVRCTVADLATRIVVPGIDPILPILELQEENGIILAGGALFQETRMVDTLTQEEMKLLLVLDGKSPVVFLSPLIGETEELSKPVVEIELQRPRSRLKSELVEGTLQVNLEFNASYILRVYSSRVDLKEQATIEEVTRDIEANLHQQTLQLVAKLQELQVDPLGIGKNFRANHYAQYDESAFRQQWADAVIDVQVDLQPFRGGTISPTR